MSAFAVFLSQQAGSVTKADLQRFRSANVTEFEGAVSDAIDQLDPKVTVRLVDSPAGSKKYPIPVSKADKTARWSATSGKQAASMAWATVKAYVDLLEAMERIFDPSKTGAFEVPEERAPKANMRFAFATAKFVDDHVCNVAKVKDPEMREEAQKVAIRRMTKPGVGPATKRGVAPLECTNITTSSTIDLHQKKNSDALKDEITARQKEFEAIYQYLVGHGRKQEILLAGDHEEVIYTTKVQLDFYECTQPAAANDTPPVNKYASNHLRYAVQKVNEQWLLHHMAGRVLADQVNTPPNNQFQAFNYAANTPAVGAVAGTFSRIA